MEQISITASPDARTLSRSPLQTWFALAAIVAVSALYLCLHRNSLTLGWLEDLPVYKAAIHAFLRGDDPYLQVVGGLHFVYPPFALYLLSVLARVMPGESEWVLIACIHVVSTFAAIFVLARVYLQQRWLTPAMAFLIWLAEPGFTGIRALYSSNVAPTIYFLALLAAVPGMRSDRWRWFYAVVFLAGIVKITFVVLLLLPILAGRKQWAKCIAMTGGIAVVYLLQQRLFPALYSGYKAALIQQVTVQKLYGYGIFGMAASVEQRLHHNMVSLGSYAVHVLFAATIFACLLWLKKRGADELAGTSRSLWLGLIVMAIVVVNPRVLHYDMYLALFAAFSVLATVLKLEGTRVLLLIPFVAVPSFLVLPGIRPWLVSQAYQLFFVLLCLVLGIIQLQRMTRPIHAPILQPTLS